MPGGPSAPAVVTNGAGVLPRAGTATIPAPSGAAMMSGSGRAGGGNPSEPKDSRAEQPTFPSEKQLAERLKTTVEDFHRNIKKEIKIDFKNELRQINSTNPDIGVTPDGNIVLRNPLTKQTITTNIPLVVYAR
jgi:hypothetical protein